MMTAAGACASKVGMKVSSGRFSSYCGGGSGSGWGSPMVGRAHAAVIIARRLQRALAPSEFLGTRLCRSVASFSVLHDRIHPPGLACGWISNQSGGRTAGAPASAHQSRKMSGGKNPFNNLVTDLAGSKSKYYSLVKFGDKRIDSLPYSIKILLESAVRNCDNFQVMKADVEKIVDWEKTSPKQVEIPFKPARVILQDFTGVPCVVDLAAMRDAIKRLGGDPNKINPLVPVDLVIDHSVQVDVAREANALQANMELEFSRNKERFAFLKWGSTAFKNMLVVPPGSGIVHQVGI